MPGEESKTGIFLKNSLNKKNIYRSSYLEIIQNVYLKTNKNLKIATNIIYALSQCDYQDVYPSGPMILLAAFSHDSDEVKEYSLRAFENWENPDMIDYLETVRDLNKQWLNDYLTQIIEDLKEISERKR